MNHASIIEYVRGAFWATQMWNTINLKNPEGEDDT
jgi:hypothetical protein